MQRRMRKLKGISKTAMNIGIFRKEYAIINVGQLDRLEPETVVTPDLLLKMRIIRDLGEGLRVLGSGELTKPLTVHAHHFSASAAEKIAAAGGRVEVL
jgi:large subunit ribosomal protein L15